MGPAFSTKVWSSTRHDERCFLPDPLDVCIVRYVHLFVVICRQCFSDIGAGSGCL